MKNLKNQKQLQNFKKKKIRLNRRVVKYILIKSVTNCFIYRDEGYKDHLTMG